MRKLAINVLAVLSVLCAGEAKAASHNAGGNLVFACREDNDLYQVITANSAKYPRFDTAAKAIESAQEGCGVLILADEYPDKTTIVGGELFELAAKKKLRLYVEYPASLPKMEVGKPQEIAYGRGVATSDMFGEGFKKLGVVEIRGCHFVPVKADNPYIILAKVAGYDTAVFGLPKKDSYPILFEHSQSGILVSTTKLSQFVTGRYAPCKAWQAIWGEILRRLGPETQPVLKWTPTVRPRYGPDEQLPTDVEQQVFKKGIQWFSDSRMFIHPSWKHKYDEAGSYPSVAPKPQLDWPVGDGSCGVLEGIASAIDDKGEQKARWMLRADCIGETAMAMAFAAMLHKDTQARKTAENLMDFLCFQSNLCKGPRNDPNSQSFGMIGWLDRANFNKDEINGYDVYFGDENARALLGMITAARLLKSDRWNDTIAKACLANLRTQGPTGFREVPIIDRTLQANGWPYYWNLPSKPEDQSSYLWACFLWAYKQSGYTPFLERSKNGIAAFMDSYPKNKGLTRRMLLPAIWLAKIEDTAQHREWVKLLASEMLVRQNKHGAILGTGGAATSNEDYGTRETSIIQDSSDPATDSLYVNNFALLNLHEAAALTSETSYSKAEEKLAEFLCRIQIHSDKHKELDGGWFRCFDYEKWEYWASGADFDWGPWCIETGWTQTWITAVLALRQMKMPLWDVIAESSIKKDFDRLIPAMMPDKIINKQGK